VYEPFLRYRGYRWLKISVLLIVVASASYLATPAAQRNGGSPVGYALGMTSAALMLWLAWFGIRKRSYAAAGAPLRGWLSAHVYLGGALIVLVPLHSAFRLGWNVHGLAAMMTVLTILSGLIGVVLYVSVPARMTQNRPGQKLMALFEQVGALDGACKTLAAGLPTAIAQAIDASIESTRVGGGVLRQLAGADPSGPTVRALVVVQRAQDAGRSGGVTETLQKLRANLTRKQIVLRRISRDLRLKALLDVWLVLHVPLGLSALALVAIHVVAVFYYR
jgi:hypothetical protein